MNGMRYESRVIDVNVYQCDINNNHNNDVLYMVESHDRKMICCDECSLAYLNKTIFFEREQR